MHFRNILGITGLFLFNTFCFNALSQVIEKDGCTMNELDLLTWLASVKKTTGDQIHIIFENEDLLNRSVIIEWKATDILSSDLVEFKKNISEIAAKAQAPSEVEFLQIFPEAVSHEMFLKPCIPLFKNGYEAVNWKEVEETIEATIKQFYLTDLSQFGSDMIKPLLNDLYIFLTVKDKATHKILGFMINAITPALPYGSLKLISMGVVNEEQDKGLESLLISSLFKIVPRVEQLFCFVRPTNTSALHLYHELGFVEDLQPVEDPNHKVNMDYLIRLQYHVHSHHISQ